MKREIRLYPSLGSDFSEIEPEKLIQKTRKDSKYLPVSTWWAKYAFVEQNDIILARNLLRDYDIHSWFPIYVGGSEGWSVKGMLNNATVLNMYCISDMSVGCFMFGWARGTETRVIDGWTEDSSDLQIEKLRKKLSLMRTEDRFSIVGDRLVNMGCNRLRIMNASDIIVKCKVNVEDGMRIKCEQIHQGVFEGGNGEKLSIHISCKFIGATTFRNCRVILEDWCSIASCTIKNCEMEFRHEGVIMNSVLFEDSIINAIDGKFAMFDCAIPDCGCRLILEEESKWLDTVPKME